MLTLIIKPGPNRNINPKSNPNPTLPYYNHLLVFYILAQNNLQFCFELK